MLARRQPFGVSVNRPRGRGYPPSARCGVWLPHLRLICPFRLKTNVEPIAVLVEGDDPSTRPRADQPSCHHVFA